MDAKRLTPNKIANLIMAEDAWHDSEYVSAEDYDALRAEVERLRADAERYRWLRDRYTILLLNGESELRITYGPRANSKSGIDTAIDAARGGEP